MTEETVGKKVKKNKNEQKTETVTPKDDPKPNFVYDFFPKISPTEQDLLAKSVGNFPLSTRMHMQKGNYYLAFLDFRAMLPYNDSANLEGYKILSRIAKIIVSMHARSREAVELMDNFKKNMQLALDRIKVWVPNGVDNQPLNINNLIMDPYALDSLLSQNQQINDVEALTVQDAYNVLAVLGSQDLAVNPRSNEIKQVTDYPTNKIKAERQPYPYLRSIDYPSEVLEINVKKLKLRDIYSQYSHQPYAIDIQFSSVYEDVRQTYPSGFSGYFNSVVETPFEKPGITRIVRFIEVTKSVKEAIAPYIDLVFRAEDDTVTPVENGSFMVLRDIWVCFHANKMAVKRLPMVSRMKDFYRFKTPYAEDSLKNKLGREKSDEKDTHMI